MSDVLYPLLLDILYDEDGTHNLIGLIEPTTSYTATWGAQFPPPPHPPAYPIIDDAATAVVRARQEAEHAILVRDFASYEAAERATAKFIRDAVDEIWYRDLRHDRSFYTHVTAKQLLSHLDDNCAGLHPSELVNLPTDMLGFYTTVDGIPEYINMLEAAQCKLTRANLPMSDDQLLAIASTAILASNHFPRPTDDWEAKPCANKTWTAWKTHYRAAHIARKHQLLASGTAMLPSTANALIAEDDVHLTEGTFARLDGYLDNLAAAATTERTTLQSLMEANAALVTNVTALTTSVASLTAAYTTLRRHYNMHLHHPEQLRNNRDGRAHNYPPANNPTHNAWRVLLDTRIPSTRGTLQCNMRQQGRRA
eukprot:CCRYP_012274-RA/>CCRYP_012274-RA protein AED:0.37 eAED:0.37 QI:0/-1/0/1/-1/1/1/0/366